MRPYVPRSIGSPHPIQSLLPESMVSMVAGASARARIRVSGQVQGVAYRAFTQRTASQHGLCGGVRNLEDGCVAVEVEGERQAVERLIASLRIGPPMAQVQEVQVQWEPPTGRYHDFQIWY